MELLLPVDDPMLNTMCRIEPSVKRIIGFTTWLLSQHRESQRKQQQFGMHFGMQLPSEG